MKRKEAIFICFVIIFIAGAFGSSTHSKAAADYTQTSLKLTTVEDIDVYNDYDINALAIDNTQLYSQDGWYVYRITLEHDGFIKLLLSSANLVKTVTKTGPGGSITTSYTTASATVYRDAMLLYPVVPSIATKATATGTVKAESPQKIALDEGVYYIAIQVDKYSCVTSGSNTILTTVRGPVGLVVYYQEVIDNETLRPSNVGKENELRIDDEFTSLLTVTNPKDYYRFELTDKALVKIDFRYASKNNAKFVLYSTDREELVAKTVTGNNVWYNVEKFLEPGTYYCSLETVTQYDGGITSLLINQTIYPLKLTQQNSTVNSYVTVSTIDAPKEIRFVKGRLTNSELTSSKWNSGKVITETLQFGVNMTGYYTVRVTDEYGNMFMQTIQVTSCDKKAPGKPTVKSFKAGTVIVSGTAEKNSTVTVVVAGRSYTCMASSKGTFKCELPYVLLKGNKIVVTAQDISGNTSEKTEVTVK